MKSNNKRSKGLFTVVDGVLVIVYLNGTYRQLSVYKRGSQLYAALTKNSFVALYETHGTSKPSVSWKEVVSTSNKEFKMVVGAMGWMELSE